MRWLLILCIFVLYMKVRVTETGSLGPDDVLVSMNFLLDSRQTCVYQYLRDNLLMHLLIDPATAVQVEVLFKYPSGIARELIRGNGTSAYMKRNLTEKGVNLYDLGDYEICIMVSSPAKVLYHMYAYDTTLVLPKTPSVENSTQNLNVSVRDVNLQLKNSAFIIRYVIGFCFSAIIVAALQVSFIRRMFYISPSRIRI